MPLCAKCQNPFACHCGAAVPKPLGAPVLDCPQEERPGAIWVHVTDERGIDVKDVGASYDGSIKPTDANGVAVYDPVPPGVHKVRISHRTVKALTLYEEPRKTTRKPMVVAGEIKYVAYQLARKPTLKVKVLEKGNAARSFEGANVTVTGTESPPPKPSIAGGLADFGLVSGGEYHVKVELKEADRQTHATTFDFSLATVDFALAAGQEKELLVEAEALNIVTPKIELEYKLVLLDRKLHDLQAAGETKIYPGATRIEVSVTQTNLDHPFTKTGSLDAPNVDIFTDEACEDPLTGVLTASDLTGKKPKELWLRGKLEGTFEVKLTLTEDPADRFVKLAAEPAKEQMGVVKLGLSVHEQDIDALKAVAMQVDPDTDPVGTYYTNLHNKAMPAQKAMSDAGKIGEPKKGDADKPGRLLHVQKDGHFGRAKLIVAKIEPNHLPPGTDDYDIVLKVGRGASFTSGADTVKSRELQGGPRDIPNSGSITLFDAESAGNEKIDVSFKVSALKAAEQTLWVEGKTETEQPCDLRLDVGMSRDAGGLANNIKRNGDWTRYTVVKIDKVDIVDTRKPGEAEAQYWDADLAEFYVNLKDDPDGRKFKLAATLSKRLKNVTLHFMLAPDPHNRRAQNWGLDMPAGWVWKDITEEVKHLDKTDRKDFLHLFEKTDGDGKATKELKLSRFGGDKFQAGAYTEQDPHLAKYVEDDPNLGSRKPVLMVKKIAVSRKFWYQLINVSGVADRDPSGAVARYERVKTRLKAATPVQITSPPEGAIRKKYQVRVNGGDTDVLVVTTVNRDSFFLKIVKEADKPIKVPVLIADGYMADNGDTGAYNLANQAAGDFPVDAALDKIVVFPPAQGGEPVVSGKFRVTAPGSTTLPGGTAGVGGVLTLEVPIKAEDLTIDPARASRERVRINLPATIGVLLNNNAQARVSVVNLVIKGAKSLNGQAFGEQPHRSVVVIYNDQSALTIGHFPNTFAHELAHNIRQVQRPGSQADGIPDHPLQYLQSGSHCGETTSPKCMMYATGPNADALNNFCDVCRPYLLATDMSPKA